MINARVKELRKLERWKNTGDTTTWFPNLKQKHCRNFVQFDIDGFYPAITADYRERKTPVAR